MRHGRLVMAEAFVTYRHLLPVDAALSYDGTEIILPRLNPTRDDLARIRRFLAVSHPRLPVRSYYHVENSPRTSAPLPRS